MPSSLSPNGSTASRRSDRRGANAPIAILPAQRSDHVGVYCFLNSVFGGPSQAEFRVSLEDPCYQPADRLLAKDEHRIVAHVQMLHRSLRLGTLRLPVAQLDWLGTAPKLQGQGLGTRLLRAAESRMVERGALVGWVRTRSPRFFSRLGWTVCGRHSRSCGDARRLLGAMIDKGLRPGARHPKLHIRPWLHWELSGLTRLYEESVGGMVGPFERSRACWRWLARRHAFDQLYVAIDGPDLIDMDERNVRVAGYAATKGNQVLELVALPSKRRVATMLLARVCYDAIEADRHAILLNAPPHDRLHKLFRRAGGRSRRGVAEDGEVFMARVFQPLLLLRRMKHLLGEHAAAAGLPHPAELGFLVGRKQYLLTFAEGRLAVAGRKSSPHTVELHPADFARMLLGQLNWERALGEGRARPHTAEAECLARTLFPPIPFWKPPLDDLKREGENPY